MQKQTGYLQEDSNIMNGSTEVNRVRLNWRNKLKNRRLRFSETKEVVFLSL